MVCEDQKWMELAQGRVQWRASDSNAAVTVAQ